MFDRRSGLSGAGTRDEPLRTSAWEAIDNDDCGCLPNLTLFQTKNVIFHTRFRTWLLKTVLIFRPDLLEIISLLLTLERQTKKIS